MELENENITATAATTSSATDYTKPPSPPYDPDDGPFHSDAFTIKVRPNKKEFGEEYHILKKLNIIHPIVEDIEEKSDDQDQKSETESSESIREKNQEYFNEDVQLKPTPTKRKYTELVVCALELKEPCSKCRIINCVCSEFH